MADAPPPADEPRSLFDRLGAALPVALTALSHRVRRHEHRGAEPGDVLAEHSGTRPGEGERPVEPGRVQAGPGASVRDDGRDAAGGRRVQACGRTPEDAHPGVRPPGRGVGEREGRPAGGGTRACGRCWSPSTPGTRTREVLPLARKVDPAGLNAEIAAGLRNVTEAEKEFNAELAAVKGQATTAANDTKASAAALRYDVDSRRYRAEATANQWVGFLYEVRVKTSTAASDRHRHRSENFFIAMLAAQGGGGRVVAGAGPQAAERAVAAGRHRRAGGRRVRRVRVPDHVTPRRGLPLPGKTSAHLSPSGRGGNPTPDSPPGTSPRRETSPPVVPVTAGAQTSPSGPPAADPRKWTAGGA
jgi:hypothetical protein